MSNELHELEAWIRQDGTPTGEFADAILQLIKENNEMNTNQKLAQIRPADGSVHDVYTSPDSKNGGRGTVITQFMATGAGTYDVYIGGSASADNQVINGAAAAVDGACPPCLIDAMIRPGESLFLAGSGIVFLVSGIERR